MKKAKTRTQMADEYGISYRTFLRWIRRNKIDLPNGLLAPSHQELIYEKFGNPNTL